MNKKIYAVLIAVLFLAGCSTIEGIVEDVKREGELAIVTFQDGRVMRFKDALDEFIPIGKYAKFEYSDANNALCEVYDRDGNVVTVEKIEKGNYLSRLEKKIDSNLLLCPRCQYTMKKGVDY